MARVKERRIWINFCMTLKKTASEKYTLLRFYNEPYSRLSELLQRVYSVTRKLRQTDRLGLTSAGTEIGCSALTRFLILIVRDFLNKKSQ